MAIPINPVSAVLQCHPETCSQAVQGIELCVGWTQGGALSLTYVLKGDIAALRIPIPRPPRRADRLWEHTCFEVFVSVKGESQYYEFNFALSGDWAAYAFRRYRDNVPLELGDEDLAPQITAQCSADNLELNAILHLNRLPNIRPRARLKLALSAVIEEKGGMLSYWALKHPPGKPDFHHADAFAVEVETPVVGAAKQSGIGSR